MTTNNNIIDDKPPLILEGEQEIIFNDEKSAGFTVGRQNAIVRKTGEKLRMYTVSTANKATGVVCVVNKQFRTGRKYLLARHWRVSTKKWHWEFPRGMGIAGESPEETAIRELNEETGLKNYSIIAVLQKIYADTGILCGDIAVVHISIPCPIYENTADNINMSNETDWELSNLCWFSFSEITEMIKNNEIDDGITLSAWCIYCNKILLE